MSDTFAIVTPTYRNDFLLAQELCRTVDKHVDHGIHHYLIVPKSDAELFKTLENGRRSIVIKEVILRAEGFRRLPLPRRINIPFVFKKKINEQWLGPNFNIVSGWVVQQLIKLSAPSFTQADNIILVDSDFMFIRKLDTASLKHDGKLILHQHQAGVDQPTHRAWRKQAKAIFKLPEDDLNPQNYIGGMLLWRRENLLKMHRVIEEKSGVAWMQYISRSNDVSEYILYGIFCVAVLGDSSLQVPANLAICKSIWTADKLPLEGLRNELSPDTVGLHIQSFIPLSIEARRTLIDEALREYPTPSA